MWWDRSELAEVYFSETCIGLRRGLGDTATWIDAKGLEEGAAHLVDALTSGDLRSCGRIRVWLGAELARPLILSSGSGARTREEAKALATMQAPDVTGIDGPVRIWANAWRKGHGGLAVIMPDAAWATLHDAIDRVCAGRTGALHKDTARSLKLVSVRPWWNQVMDVVIEDSAKERAAMGWSLAEAGGVVHGIVNNGVPVEAGFDLLGAHDDDGSRLRRRLQVSWGAMASSQHLDLVRHGEGRPVAIGSWSPSSGESP